MPGSLSRKSGRAAGGAEEPERSDAQPLIEGVFRHGLQLGEIELGALTEVVPGGFLGDLFCSPGTGPTISSVYPAPGGMKARGRGGLADVAEEWDHDPRIDAVGKERAVRPVASGVVLGPSLGRCIPAYSGMFGGNCGRSCVLPVKVRQIAGI